MDLPGDDELKRLWVQYAERHGIMVPAKALKADFVSACKQWRAEQLRMRDERADADSRIALLTSALEQAGLLRRAS